MRGDLGDQLLDLPLRPMGGSGATVTYAADTSVPAGQGRCFRATQDRTWRNGREGPGPPGRMTIERRPEDGRSSMKPEDKRAEAPLPTADELLIAQAHDQPNQVIANAAESSLEHHLGMTCDPVAGFVQVPCIERCAFGAVKAWTGFMIASNEIPTNRRVDFDTTVAAMALTAKEMNSKYKETSEGGLAVSVTLC
jgi:Serine dehydratase alpha chain